MISCKNCQQTNTIKNGFVRGKQRYKCHTCHYTFVVGDERHKLETDLKKALSVILYSLGKASFGFLAKLFGVSRTTPYYWIRDIAATTEEPVIASNIHEIDFDEMWHFVQSKKSNSGSSKPWIIAQGELLPGYSVVVMLQRSNAYMTK
jgi:transposase